MIIGNIVLKGEKNGTGLISSLSDVPSMMARRVLTMSGHLASVGPGSGKVLLV